MVDDVNLQIEAGELVTLLGPRDAERLLSWAHDSRVLKRRRKDKSSSANVT